jgi:hypothetical protein
VTTFNPSTADRTVAVKQRRADDAEQYDGPACTRDGTMRERHQRKRAALALVVGAQENENVFGRDDEQQCPNDQRENAEDRLLGRRVAASDCGGDGFANSVERAGSNISVDHADAAERQREEACMRCFGRMQIAAGLAGGD